MFRSGKLAMPLALAGFAMAWAGFTFAPSTPLIAGDQKPVDLSALREAVDTASKRGENVDDVRKALDVFEKALPTIKPGAVPPELQALRDAVDAAARKGENVEEITKQLVAVEMVVAGKSLAKPRPQPNPRPDPNVQPNPFPRPNPGLIPFPEVPFPNLPPGGGIDPGMIREYLELRRKAQELILKNPRDPNAIKEAQKLLAEANEVLMKAGAGAGLPVPLMPNPGFARVPDRARLGIRMEKVTPIVAEQLGLEANKGIVIVSVVEGSAAAKAGLKAHDIILEFAGKPVSDNTDDFARMVNDVKTGAKVDAVVMRKGKKVDVKGIELPEAPKRAPLPEFPLPDLFPALPDDPLVPVPPIKLLPLPAPPVPAVPGGNGEFNIKGTQNEQ